MAKEDILKKYKTHFKSECVLVRAPGRINIIGEHTDYNDGWVLPAAINKAMWFALGKSNDLSTNTLVAADLDAETTFSFSQIQISQDATWKDYLQAVLQILLEKGIPVKGTNGVLGGNIPHGAGLSSSAALCCGFIYGLSKLHKFFIPKEEIALAAQEAEHRIGLNCGLMDQCAVLFGKKKRALLLDCRSLDYESIPIELGSYSLVLINSNIKHALAAGSGYNNRRASCERVVDILQKKHPHIQSLRDVDAALLEKYSTECANIDVQRASYVLKENKRVSATVEALKQGDIETVGKILYTAHEGMRTAYEITVPEIDLLVDLTKKYPEILGARMVGGGFGGCTINLIRNVEKEKILSEILSAYQKETNIKAEIIEVEIGDGVGLEDL